MISDLCVFSYVFGMDEFGLKGQGQWETETVVDPPQSALKCFQRGLHVVSIAE